MIQDDLIWQVIKNNCSFLIKTETNLFCRSPYSLTGLCDRTHCPLANSNYATVIEKEGKCYLLTKTIERAHMPNKLWHKQKLKTGYQSALKQIDKLLEFWPELVIHKCKQRFTKIRQYLLRTKKLALSSTGKLVSVKKKSERRETTREAKAYQAAKIENSIELELLERKKQGIYDHIYNWNQQDFNKQVSKEQTSEHKREREIEYDQEFEEQYDIEDIHQLFDSKKKKIKVEKKGE